MHRKLALILKGDLPSLLRKIAHIPPNIGFVELWLAPLLNGRGFSREEFLNMMGKISVPVILKSGGIRKNDGMRGENSTWKDEKTLLQKASTAGVAYIDLPFDTPKEQISVLLGGKKRAPKTRLILSFHDFAGTGALSDYKKLVQTCRKKGADLVKISTFIRRPEDLATLMELLKTPGKKLIAIPMGNMGRWGRIIFPYLGSAICYAIPEKPKKGSHDEKTGLLSYGEMVSHWAMVSRLSSRL